MYNVEIITKYNVIHLQVEDLQNEEFIEIISQPYVIEVKAEKVKTLSLKK